MDKHCTEEIILEISDIKSSVEKIINATAEKLDFCYGNATLQLPETTPYLPEITKCTSVVA